MAVYDQITKAFQDIIAPELHVLRGDIRLLDQRIVSLDQKLDGVDARLDQRIGGLDQKLDGVEAHLGARIDGLRGELLAEIRRLDARMESMVRELRTAIDIRERLAALEARRAP